MAQTQVKDAYSIAVIGGDGIGPEVVAEALKVLEAVTATRSELDDDRLRPRRPALARDRRDAAGRRPRRAARPRRDPARRGRHPERAARRARARACCSRCASSSTSTSTCARPLFPGVEPAASRDPGGIDFVVIRENTEGTYAGEGGFLRKGTPHEIATQVGQHPYRRRARRPLRVRARAGPAAQAPHARAQDQRAHVRRRPVAAHLRRGRRRVPRRERPPTTTSTRRASTWSGPRPLRRDRHRQPLRRHPHRPRRRGRRRHRPRRVGATSTRRAPARRCSSRSTARRPTSPGQGKADPTARSSRSRMLLDHLGLDKEAARVDDAVAADLAERGDAVRSTTAVGDAVASRL